jgi:Ca2+-binding RTX toxin-like protein
MFTDPTSLLAKSWLTASLTDSSAAIAGVIDGTPQNDRINGTAADETIFGRAGDDTLLAGAGNDILYGGVGNDRLIGGVGDDLMFGGAGNDVMNGGAGNDTISYAGPNVGSVQVDLLNGTVGSSYGNDLAHGIENVIGSERGDSIQGNLVANILDGGNGADFVFGYDGNDSLVGGNGNDRLFGGADNDILVGGAGNDIIVGGAGSDLLFGGAAADRFEFSVTLDTEGTDRVWDFQAGIDKLVISDLTGGTGSIPPVTFTEQTDGTTLVTVGDPLAPIFEITVNEVSGTISASDILFTFMG